MFRRTLCRSKISIIGTIAKMYLGLLLRQHRKQNETKTKASLSEAQDARRKTKILRSLNRIILLLFHAFLGMSHTHILTHI